MGNQTPSCCKWKKRKRKTTALRVMFGIGPVCFVRLSSAFLRNYTSRAQHILIDILIHSFTFAYLLTQQCVCSVHTKKVNVPKRKAMGFRFAFDFHSLSVPLRYFSSSCFHLDIFSATLHSEEKTQFHVKHQDKQMCVCMCEQFFSSTNSAVAILRNYMRFTLCPMQCVGTQMVTALKFCSSFHFSWLLLAFCTLQRAQKHANARARTHSFACFQVMLNIVGLNVIHSKQLLKLGLENYAFLSTVVTVKISLDFTQEIHSTILCASYLLLCLPGIFLASFSFCTVAFLCDSEAIFMFQPSDFTYNSHTYTNIQIAT